MSDYRATIRVDGDTLHTSRPLTAPEQVTDLVDAIVYDVVHNGRGVVTSVTLDVSTADDSGTPLADSIPVTSQTPMHAAPTDDDEDPTL